MNKLKLFVIILFSSNLAISQINDEINKVYKKEKKIKERIDNEYYIKKYSDIDTLYIFFNKSEVSTKYQFIQNRKPNNKKKDTIINYNYLLKDSSSFTFFYKRFFDFDQMESGTPSLVLEKNKKFLREIRKKLLKNSFFKKNDRRMEPNYFAEVLYEIISTKKVIFLIDEDEFFCDKIILRQVKLDVSSNKFFSPRL